jgi:uncharacterized protein YndB with AHSA1/START domain
MNNPITISAEISCSKQTAWELYTQPQHIVNWNFASDDWECPSATSNLTPGGKYTTRMQAKDGSFGFDLEAIFTEVIPQVKICYSLYDDRAVEIHFEEKDGKTIVTTHFEAESENPREMQQQGWQAILNNFKQYCESK